MSEANKTKLTDKAKRLRDYYSSRGVGNSVFLIIEMILVTPHDRMVRYLQLAPSGILARRASRKTQARIRNPGMGTIILPQKHSLGVS